MIAQTQRAQCPSPKCLDFWIEADSAQGPIFAPSVTPIVLETP